MQPPSVLPPILLVDDEPDLCEEMADFLGAHGYEVMLANSAPAATAMLEARPDICVVITDIRMPMGDGLQFTRDILHARPAFLALEVLLITGNPTQENAAVAAESGARAVFGKPVRGSELLAALSVAAMRALERRAAA